MNQGVSSLQGQGGFTLVEVLVTLSIVAALGTLMIPNRRPPAQAQLRADTNHLVAALRITRSAAVSQNRDMTFLLDTARRTFSSQAVPLGTIDSRTEIKMETFEALRSDSMGGIQFFASGRSTGGRIRLELGPFKTRIHVIWATGNVAVME